MGGVGIVMLVTRRGNHESRTAGRVGRGDSQCEGRLGADRCVGGGGAGAAAGGRREPGTRGRAGAVTARVKNRERTMTMHNWYQP